MTRSTRPRTRALVACGRPALASALAFALRRAGAEVEVHADGPAVLGALARSSHALACIDLALPGDPLLIASRLAEGAPGCRLLLMAEPVTVAAARAALRVRAIDCVGDEEAPERAGELAAELVRRPPLHIPSALLAAGAEPWHIAGLTSRSPAMRRLLHDLEAVAPSDTPVLLTGESGSGKRLCAEALHQLSPRRDRALVVLSCPGLSAAMLSQALYGSAGGQDAEPPTSGLLLGALRQARGGTLLLDNVASLDGEAQGELLRALSASLPAFANRPLPAAGQTGPRRKLPAPRLITTATEELPQLVRRGRFRRELFHRIAVVRLALPPLRARRDDVPLLAAEFLDQRSRELGQPGMSLQPAALDALCRYPWPGNVRELRNVIWHAALRVQGGQLRLADVHDLLERTGAAGRLEIPLGVSLAAAEREIILQTLAAHGGNKKQAAESLIIARRTLYLKLRQYETGQEPPPMALLD